MTKPTDISTIILKHKMWLETTDGDGILGDGKWKILRAVAEEGSLRAACRKLQITYRRTWGDLKKIEQQLGFPLLDKRRGGKDGGTTELSLQGRKLVEAFDKFHQTVDDRVQSAFEDFMNTLREIQ